MTLKNYLTCALIGALVGSYGCRTGNNFFIVHSPKNWTKDNTKENSGEIVSMNNFKGRYGQGGFIPREGAEIVIVAEYENKQKLDDMIKEYVNGETIQDMANMSVADCNARKVVFESSVDPGPSYKNTVVFMPLTYNDRPAIIKFILTYGTEEKKSVRSGFDANFNQVLDSTRLKTQLAKCADF